MKRPSLTAAVGIALALLPLLAAAGLWALAPAPGEPEPTAYAAGPGNASAMQRSLSAAGYSVRSVVSTLELIDAYDAARPAVLLALPPAEPYGPRERHALDAWLADGGSIVLADGTGASTSWLAGYGAEVVPVRLLHANATDRPVVPMTSDFPGAAAGPLLGDGAGKLAIAEHAPWRAILEAGPDVHADLDGDGFIGRTDPPGPHLVGASLAVGSEGRLVVLADPGLLLDANWANASSRNEAFLLAVLEESTPSAGTILIDESQRGWTLRESLPAQWTRLTQRASGENLLGQALLGALSLSVVVALVAARPPTVPYEAHRSANPMAPVQAPAVDEAEFYQDAALSVLAARSGVPAGDLRQADTVALANRFASDQPHILRALQGDADPETRRRVLHDYLQTQGGPHE